MACLLQALAIYYLKRKNKTTTNWNCSKYQTHKCRATAITDGENFIETRGQHNHDISTGKPDARLVLKNIKELSDSNTPTVAVATAIQPITDNIATQLALPSKENLVRTAQRARKQREEVLPVSPATRSFEIPELFKNFIRFDSGQNDHERRSRERKRRLILSAPKDQGRNTNGFGLFCICTNMSHVGRIRFQVHIKV